MLNDLKKLRTIGLKTPRELDWWIEICTDCPSCIYYFGAFEGFTTAASAQHGYILDLLEEGAKILSVKIKQCQPQQLTIVIQNNALRSL